MDEDVLAHIKGAKEGFFFVHEPQNAPITCSSSCCCISHCPPQCRRGFCRGGPAIALSRNVFTTFAVQLFLKIQTRSKGNWFKTCAPGAQEDVPDMSSKITPKPAIFVNRSGGGDGTWSDHRSHRAKFPWRSCSIILADAAQQ